MSVTYNDSADTGRHYTDMYLSVKAATTVPPMSIPTLFPAIAPPIPSYVVSKRHLNSCMVGALIADTAL